MKSEFEELIQALREVLEERENKEETIGIIVGILMEEARKNPSFLYQLARAFQLGDSYIGDLQPFKVKREKGR